MPHTCHHHHSLVLLWHHDVHALAVQPQVYGRVAELQGCATTEHLHWAHDQAATCSGGTGNTNDGEIVGHWGQPKQTHACTFDDPSHCNIAFDALVTLPCTNCVSRGAQSILIQPKYP